jgi:hypothetical protein
MDQRLLARRRRASVSGLMEQTVDAFAHVVATDQAAN